MKLKQAKKTFGIKGTKRLRKLWQIAINRGKTPNKHLNEEANHNVAGISIMPIISKKSIKRYLRRHYKVCQSGGLYRKSYDTQKAKGLRELNITDSIHNAIAIIYGYK